MHHARRISLLIALTALVAPATPVRAAGNAAAPTKATEVGITADEIRIGVIADVDNAAVPGLFQGSVNGIKGFAKYINKNGGLAGRKLVVDFIDSKLNADEARNATIEACAKDFALVGTTALFLNNVDDIVACPDRAGSATGIPDLAAIAFELVQQCSPVTFPTVAPIVDCATRDQHPQTFPSNSGRARYFQKRFGELHGAYIYSGDLKSANDAGRGSMAGMQDAGIKADVEADISNTAPQSAYTSIVQQIKDAKSTYVQNGLSQSSIVALRREAKLQGLNTVKVWDCTLQCYDGAFLEEGGADIEGQFVTLPFLPWGVGDGADDRKVNPMLANFVKYTGRDKADGFAAQAWIAGVLFRDAVNQIVETNGDNALTRAALLEALASIVDFDADGMYGTSAPGRGEGSPCYVQLQVKGGTFKRVHPSKPGTFDCSPKNIVRAKRDLFGGE